VGGVRLQQFCLAKPKPIILPAKMIGRGGGRFAAEDIGQTDTSKIKDTGITYSN